MTLKRLVQQFNRSTNVVIALAVIGTGLTALTLSLASRQALTSQADQPPIIRVVVDPASAKPGELIFLSTSISSTRAADQVIWTADQLTSFSATGQTAKLTIPTDYLGSLVTVRASLKFGHQTVQRSKVIAVQR